MIGFLRQVRCGIDAGKFFEVVNKVRLIEIAAAGGHICPGKVLTGANLLQDLLKTADASKKLWRKPNFVGEELKKRRELMPISSASSAIAGV